MHHPVLRLCEDILSNGAALALPPLARMIFVVHGVLTTAGRSLSDGEAWHGEGPLTILAGNGGVSIWRWEFAPEPDGHADLPDLLPGVTSREKLSAPLRTLPKGELLLRGDSVAFPAGGCAHLHRHPGPGIRCLLEGGIRIDTHGSSTSYGPGSAWYESGPDAVFAQAASDRPSRFIRVMILPRDLLGKSSILFVNDEDRNKPRVQQYKILADCPIARPMDLARQ
jgi:quercetin dioxygenase-like cupin family protein